MDKSYKTYYVDSKTVDLLERLKQETGRTKSAIIMAAVELYARKEKLK